MTRQRTRRSAGKPATASVLSAAIPLWRQIETRLKQSIAQGEYAPGSRLPPDRQIAATFNANRLTARRALASLEQQGLIRIEQGNGTFVAENVIRYSLGKRVRFNQNLRARDSTPRRELLGASEVKATRDVARRLGIGVGDLVVKIDLLGLADERPISVMSRFAPGERFAGLAAAFKREQSFTAVLRQFGIEDYRRMLTEVTARLPTPFEARLLKQPKSQAVLACESVDVDLEGVAISYQVGCFSGERVALVVEDDQKD